MNGFFLNFFILKKKGVYSQTTFALLLILYFSLLVFSYFYYQEGTENYSKLQIEHSQLDILSLIDQTILRAVVLENQTILFDQGYFLENTDIILNNSNIILNTYTNTFQVKNSYSLFGVSFCESQNVNLQLLSQLSFNGSCILMSIQ